MKEEIEVSRNETGVTLFGFIPIWSRVNREVIRVDIKDADQGAQGPGLNSPVPEPPKGCKFKIPRRERK